MAEKKELRISAVFLVLCGIILNVSGLFTNAKLGFPANQLTRFVMPLTISFYTMFLNRQKYFSGLFKLAGIYLLTSIFYFLIYNRLSPALILANRRDFFSGLLFGTNAINLYTLIIALQFALIFPVIKRLFELFPLALTVFSVMLTVFFQYTYISGTVIYYRIEVWEQAHLFGYMWLFYVVLGLWADKYSDKAVKNKKPLLIISLPGFLISFIWVYSEARFLGWGWSPARPSVMLLSAAALSLFLSLSGYTIGSKRLSRIFSSLPPLPMFLIYPAVIDILRKLLPVNQNLLSFILFTAPALGGTFIFGILWHYTLKFASSREHSS